MNNVFAKADILLPKNCDMTKWSVVACDQYTSEPEYWSKVEDFVSDEISSLRLILPEIYLEEADVESRINRINATMQQYLHNNVFNEYKSSMFYVERTLANGKIRKGIVCAVDLECYNYLKGSKSLVRATEKTVLERIPPRLKVRENALLELPHVMLLIDDRNGEIINYNADQLEKVYDFNLMQDSGSIKGYKLTDTLIEKTKNQLDAMCDITYFNEKYSADEKKPLLFAVGDGNHSLATAKKYYENVTSGLTREQKLNNISRYALCEIVNLHDESLEFEPIHRVVFDVDTDKFIQALYEYYDIDDKHGKQKITVVTKDFTKDLFIKNPKSSLAVGSLQIFIDDYISENGGKVDYIHGEEVVNNLAQKGNIGFFVPCIEKNQLFETVIKDGALPRKTFSMGEAKDKRFYLELRKIK